MKKVKDNKTYFFECECHSPDHVIGMSFDAEEKEVTLHTQLAQHNNIFKRIVLAVKYVFGYSPQYGHWDTTMMNEEKFMDLYNLMTRFIYTAGFTNKAAIKIKQGIQEIKSGKKNSAVPQGLHTEADRTNQSKYKKV